MLYVDGMNGLITHNETVQWLYSLVGSKVKNMNINFHKILPQSLQYRRCTVKLTQQHHLCTDKSEIIIFLTALST